MSEAPQRVPPFSVREARRVLAEWEERTERYLDQVTAERDAWRDWARDLLRLTALPPGVVAGWCDQALRDEMLGQIAMWPHLAAAHLTREEALRSQGRDDAADREASQTARPCSVEGCSYLAGLDGRCTWHRTGQAACTVRLYAPQAVFTDAERQRLVDAAIDRAVLGSTEKVRAETDAADECVALLGALVRAMGGRVRVPREALADAPPGELMLTDSDGIDRSALVLEWRAPEPVWRKPGEEPRS